MREGGNESGSPSLQKRCSFQTAIPSLHERGQSAHASTRTHRYTTCTHACTHTRKSITHTRTHRNTACTRTQAHTHAERERERTHTYRAAHDSPLVGVCVRHSAGAQGRDAGGAVEVTRVPPLAGALKLKEPIRLNNRNHVVLPVVGPPILALLCVCVCVCVSWGRGRWGNAWRELRKNRAQYRHSTSHTRAHTRTHTRTHTRAHREGWLVFNRY